MFPPEIIAIHLFITFSLNDIVRALATVKLTLALFHEYLNIVDLFQKLNDVYILLFISLLCFYSKTNFL